MNTSYKGKNLQVLMGGKSIALATSHTLSITINTADTTTKDSAGQWQEAEVQSMSWSMTSDNLVSHGTDGHDTKAVIDAALVGNKVTLIFGLASPIDAVVPTGGFTSNTSATDKFGYTGDAIITSVSMTANNGERATYSITFTGVGALTALTYQSE